MYAVLVVLRVGPSHRCFLLHRNKQNRAFKAIIMLYCYEIGYLGCFGFVIILL